LITSHTLHLSGEQLIKLFDGLPALFFTCWNKQLFKLFAGLVTSNLIDHQPYSSSVWRTADEAVCWSL
jgi:hypothetical protein